MNKQELTINVYVPDGYEAIDYRPPKNGEIYFCNLDRKPKSGVGAASYPKIILKKKHNLSLLLVVFIIFQVF